MLIKMDIQSKKNREGGLSHKRITVYLSNTTFHRGRNMEGDKLRNTCLVSHTSFPPVPRIESTFKNKSNFYFILILSQFKTTLINMLQI